MSTIRYGDQRIERRRLSLFCRQFGSMLSAGIDYLPIISVLREQSESADLREILDSLERDLKLGRLLSTSMCRFPKTFSPYFINMVRQGEREDILDQVFVKLADQLDYEAHRFDGHPDGAMSTPAAAAPRQTAGDVYGESPWLGSTLAVIGIAIGALWHLTNLGLLPQRSLAPNVCLISGAVLLVSCWLRQRRRAPMNACAWCGAEAEGELTARGGVALCAACLRAESASFSPASGGQEMDNGGPPRDPAIADETEEEIVGYDIDMESLYEEEA